MIRYKLGMPDGHHTIKSYLVANDKEGVTMFADDHPVVTLTPFGKLYVHPHKHELLMKNPSGWYDHEEL